MEKVVNIYKFVGETPLDVIRKFQKIHPEYEGVKIAYAGRLDPMAEGVLILLIGDECKKRKTYENLEKEYEFEVLFGVTTDTYDLLGIATEIKNINPIIDLKKFVGKYTQPYPPYSAARVNGKPLYYWARENKLDEIAIPTNDVEVFSLTETNSTTISSQELLKNISEKISKVDGNFRQKIILEKWGEALRENTTFQLRTYRATCSSGTYIRSIAQKMGGTAFSIKRTIVGEYKLEDSLRT